jgi:hypothetical protein
LLILLDWNRETSSCVKQLFPVPTFIWTVEIDSPVVSTTRGNRNPGTKPDKTMQIRPSPAKDRCWLDQEEQVCGATGAETASEVDVLAKPLQ